MEWNNRKATTADRIDKITGRHKGKKILAKEETLKEEREKTKQYKQNRTEEKKKNKEKFNKKKLAEKSQSEMNNLMQRKQKFWYKIWGQK